MAGWDAGREREGVRSARCVQWDRWGPWGDTPGLFTREGAEQRIRYGAGVRLAFMGARF
ncbi:hypothetical protein GCM10023259_097450 [Thermocatellispora tengchongensis]